MNKNVLIIRSSSYVMFSEQLQAVKQKFPNATFSLLEQPAAMDRAMEFADDFKEIITYSHPPAYHPFNSISFIKPYSYSDVVVLYANENGEGYLNVDIVACRFPAERIWSCSSSNKISQVSRCSVAVRAFSIPVWSLLKSSLIITCILAVCFIGMLKNLISKTVRS